MKYLFRSLTRYREADSLDEVLVNDRKVGLLGYSWGGMIAVILLLCFACAGFVALQSIISTLLPKQFFNAGASNKTIAFFITTMPYVINMILTPVLSFRSDRTRTRIGRRMPYLLVSVPFIALFSGLLGWSELIGGGVERFMPEMLAGKGILVTLAFFAVAYHVAFMVPGTIFWYLFPDVIPPQFIGRFMSYYNLTGSAVGWIINSFFLKFAETGIGWLYSAVSLFFLISMMIMIFAVREGSYPPPAETGKGASAVTALIDSIRIYCKECYSIGFYYWFFATMALSEISMVCRTMYNMIYATESLRIPLDRFGEIMGWSGIVGLVLSLPLGYLCDKFNALRVFGLGLLLVVVVNLGSFYMVKDEQSFFITTILLSVVYTTQMVATIPVFVMILPKQLYGQFSSANALFRAFLMAIAGFGGGVLLDAVGNYQYIYLWDFIFTLAALGTFAGLYIAWKRHGGQAGYVAPMIREAGQVNSAAQ